MGWYPEMATKCLRAVLHTDVAPHAFDVTQAVIGVALVRLKPNETKITVNPSQPLACFVNDESLNEFERRI